MGVPTVDKPPGGLKTPWLDIWRAAHAELKAAGIWKPTLWPVLNEYVVALRTAQEHRAVASTAVQTIHHRARDGEEAYDEELPAGFQRNMESGLTSEHKGFASADRETKRAAQLADFLGLSPKAQKALVEKLDAEPEEPDAFTQADELSQRRTAKTAHA